MCDVVSQGSGGFSFLYDRLQERFARQCDYEGTIYLPTIRPKGPVEYVFVGREPSKGRWADLDAEAKQKISLGFRNFYFSYEDFILHFAIQEYLKPNLYYLTDVAKGAMLVNDAQHMRYDSTEIFGQATTTRLSPLSVVSGIATVLNAAVPTQGGVVTFNVTSSVGGDVRFRASSVGIPLGSAEQTARFLAGSAQKISVSVEPVTSLAADNVSQAELFAKVTDAQGNLVTEGSYLITFTKTMHNSATIMPSQATVATANGVARLTVTATSNVGTDSFVASSSGLQSSASVSISTRITDVPKRLSVQSIPAGKAGETIGEALRAGRPEPTGYGCNGTSRDPYDLKCYRQDQRASDYRPPSGTGSTRHTWSRSRYPTRDMDTCLPANSTRALSCSLRLRPPLARLPLPVPAHTIRSLRSHFRPMSQALRLAWSWRKPPQ